MKKISVLIFIIMIVIMSLVFNIEQNRLPDTYSNVELYIDSKECSNYLYNGLDMIVIDNTSFNRNKKYYLECAKGVTYVYEDIAIETLLKQMNAKLVKYEKVNGVLIYYAYSKRNGKGVNINNQNVNIQIAYSNDIVKVGIPIIYGSF